MLPLAVCLAMGFTQLGQVGVGDAAARISIDDCVDADREEIVRLLAIELAAGSAGAPAPRGIVVTCTEQRDIVRLYDPENPQQSSRILDLSAWGVAARKARTRELSLVIAELLREPDNVPKKSAPPRAEPPRLERARVERAQPPRTSEQARVEIALLLGAEKYSGGHAQLGIGGGLRLGAPGPLVFDVRVGARGVQTVLAPAGEIHAVGFVSAMGVGVDLFPDTGKAGLAAMGRLELDWIFARGSVSGSSRATARSANGVALIGSIAASAWFSLSRRLRLVAEPALLLPIKPLSLEDRAADVSAISGIGAAAALGLLLRL